MRLTCDVHALLRAATACSGVARADKDRPVLGCLKLSTDGDRLTVLGYNAETWVRQVVIGVEVEEPGACLLPAHNLVEWLGEFRVGRLSLLHDGQRTHARVGKGERRFAVYPIEQYPEPDPTVHTREYATPHHGVGVMVLPSAHKADVLVPCPDLLAGFARVGFACDRRDSSKFTTTGVNLEVRDCSLTLAATDMNHMSATRLETAFVGPEVCETVPRDVLPLLPVVLAHEAEVTISLSEHSVVFRGQTAELGTRLLAGRFPPWRELSKLANRAEASRILLPAVLFTQAVRQATAGITEGEQRFRLDLSFRDRLLTLSVPVADAPVVDFPLDADVPDLKFSTYHPGLVDFLRVALSQQASHVEAYPASAANRPWLLRALPGWDYYPARMVEPKPKPEMEVPCGAGTA